ncbi:1,4-dihydroxy-6-naphthoate synthase [Desulfocicer vacuolatum DSM 3385]|uniref:1,4-dihydroxy-6-naphtoate synthase n=1 Tax=Desulfocicer vacuolatum DSM 3385 TaxID=1121400 RepID=A0A1W2B822_9BACT|nr:1,4-dihydroxy-6-naphthoate synthase [Desulfocicer vacuolatum]SMC68842.1 1,4-dihydroxy-6-naphthoate synthase [Desulfocicer vacuolatum DSM 3385]
MSQLSLAYSSCPNDTYIFHAMVHGLINTADISFNTSIADVETLNQKAAKTTYDITKLSFAAMGNLGDKYRILRSGAALGRGCGPLVIAMPGQWKIPQKKVTVAVPGLGTTACLLFRFYLEDQYPGLTTELIPLPFEQVMPAVKTGKATLGVIIHEGRFVYEHMGFELIRDLGQWWEQNTGLPIPLGCIAVKKEMERKTATQVESIIRQSISHAKTFPEKGVAYIRHHAQELADTVIQEHIKLYVNDFSMDLGPEGEKAIVIFFKKAQKTGILPPGPDSWFMT